MTRAREFRRRLAVLILATGLLSAFSVVAAIPAAADVACASGAHTLSHFGDRVYPEMGNGGYTSLHTDVHMVYDATTNLFLPGNRVDLTDMATQCLSDFSLDFERSGPGGGDPPQPGPDMTVDSVTVNGSPATWTFKQPTYPGDPNGQDDPDPAAHAVSNVNPVGGGNPNPPACSPQVEGNSQNGTQCPANKLVITPSAPIASGSTFVVSIAYTGRPGVHDDGDGTQEGWFRSNSPVGDGGFVTTEPVGSMAWMPLNNHPLAKPTYDFYDTVNVGKVAIANGLLLTTNPPPTNPPDANFPAGSVTWIWHSPEPIASYLVENSVGAFDLTSATSDGIVFYEAQGSSISATRKATNKAVMDQQPDITRFQSIFNGPFPLTTNGVIVGIPDASFQEEMQGKITFNGGRISLGTFNHENMHQWFGDNVAEAAFNLTFWKEGWATVGEYLRTARLAQTAAGGPGTTAGDAAFDTSLINRFNSNQNYGSAGDFWTSAPSNPTVENLFNDDSTYTRPGTAYLALRQILDSSYSRLASDRWIKAMKQIQSQYGGGNITEAQLEAVFHQWLPNQSPACSTKLDTFFTQWFDTAYPPDGGANKPQITGPGIGGTSDHFYNDASPCTRADQAITFGALPDKFFDDPDFAVGASSDSGLPVSFAASGQCTVTGSTVHITGLGSCTITASQTGDLVFKPATDVPQTFAITKHPQTITFAAISPKAYLDADFVVSPTASSGLPVSLVAVGDCSINSTVAPATVHIVQAGSCTITASQAGDVTYDPAPDVLNTFAIAEAQVTALPVHTWVSLKNGDDVGTSFDVKVELLKNGTIIDTGLLRCVNAIPRNPAGKVIEVPWAPATDTVDKGDILSLRVSTRIGTNGDDSKCAGHGSAVGLRLYYDSAAQASRLSAKIGSVPAAFTEYLRSNGNVCKNAESTEVGNRDLDPAAPGAAPGAKCKDSTTVKFAGGNLYKEIGIWGGTGNWILP